MQVQERVLQARPCRQLEREETGERKGRDREEIGKRKGDSNTPAVALDEYVLRLQV
jgi:hypothetical protein